MKLCGLMSIRNYLLLLKGLVTSAVFFTKTGGEKIEVFESEESL